MGLGASRPRQKVSRTELLKATSNNRDFTNKLFQVMLSTLTEEDILKLGDYRMCSKYVFLMAETLESLFRDIQIRPRQEKSSGVVYFQKVDKLTEKSAETKNLCLVIAYFYVRIFQIFGSLALSIIDDPNAGSVLGAVAFAPPGRPIGGPRRIPGAIGAVLTGGASTTDFTAPQAQQFAGIAGLLGTPTPYDGQPAFQFQEDGSMSVYLLPNTRTNNLVKVLAPGQLVRCTLSIARSVSKTTFIPVTTGTVTNFSYVHSGDPKVAPINLALQAYKPKAFEIKESGSQWFTATGDTLFTALNKLFLGAEKIISNPTRAPGAGKPGFVPVGAVGFGPGQDTTLRELQTKYIIDTMKALTGQASGPRSTAFCVARAIQLLDAQTLFQPKPTQGTSGICMAKFDRVGPSIPVPGTRIDSVPGIKALDQLFHDNPHTVSGTQQTFAVDVSDTATYASFLQEMSQLFGSPHKGKLTGMESILAKDPNCTPSSLVGHYLRISDPKETRVVVELVQRMFGRQLAHTNRVIECMKQELFIIRRQKTPGGVSTVVDIHPKLLTGGIGAVNALGRKARELLVGYYKDCETMYQSGVAQILKSGRFQAL